MRPDTRETLKYASLVIGCSTETLLQHFDLGDIVQVCFDGKVTLQVPLCGEYDDVSPGEVLLRAKSGKKEVTIAANYGEIGVQLGFICETPPNGDYKYRINAHTYPAEAEISLVEKGGCLDWISIGKMHFSEVRSDYPELTDAEYCNFREVSCGGIRPGRLYRSSSPIDPEISRNAYADALLPVYGIRTVVNMSDSAEGAARFAAFPGSNYAKLNVRYVRTGLAYRTAAFNAEIAACIRVIIENEGPYLVHCVYGKDRTGLLIALLAGFLGAGEEEIREDYLKTYDNLYHVADGRQQPVPETNRALIRDRIMMNLDYVMDSETGDLRRRITAYLRTIGLTDEELDRLRRRLSG